MDFSKVIPLLFELSMQVSEGEWRKIKQCLLIFEVRRNSLIVVVNSDGKGPLRLSLPDNIILEMIEDLWFSYY